MHSSLFLHLILFNKAHCSHVIPSFPLSTLTFLHSTTITTLIFLKPKILYLLTPGFAADESDTTCIPFLQQFCISFQRVNPEVKLVIFAFQYPFTPKTYLWNGIEVIALGGSNKKGPSRIALWLKIMRHFMLHKKDYQVLGMFSIWLTECAFVGKMLSALYNLKHFIWIVGQDARAKNRYVKLVRPNNNQLVAFSGFIQQHIHQNFGLTPAHIIGNGINPEMFEPINTGPRSIDIIGVGSLITLKQFDRFIEIVEHVAQQIPLTRVVICGEGPDRSRLEKLILDKNLGHLIQLAGNVQHKNVLQLMNQSRLLLHTSEYDSNATVLHEALYAGCTVISTCPIDPANSNKFFLLKEKHAITKQIFQQLSAPNDNYSRVTTNLMDNTAKQVLQLFTN